MGRKIIVGTLALLSVGLLLRLIVSPGSAHAQSVEQASERLDKTEQKLADEVNASKSTAKALEDDLGAPEGQGRLSGELAEFGRSTERLHQLQAELEKDIASYDTARTAKLADFENELKQIKDAGTRRHMERLRARAHHHTTEALQNAQTALDALNTVLAQGTDLQHAARCVQLADELHLQGSDLETQVQRAKEHVASYSRLSTTLLAKLTTGTTATD